MGIKKRYRVIGVLFLLLWVSTYPVQAFPLLPDLITLPPSELSLVLSDGGKKKLVRFTNSILNDGPGDLIIRGEFIKDTQKVLVYQTILSGDGSQGETPIGELVYHAEHEHWHWDNFSLYEILPVEEDGSLGEAVASSGKVSYCMRDDRMDPQAMDDQFPKKAKFRSCGWQRQGITVGWIDVYAKNTPGQFIDISHLADGVYALRSTANPEGILMEVDPSNNGAVTYFRLEGKLLEELDMSEEAVSSAIKEGLRDLPLFGLEER